LGGWLISIKVDVLCILWEFLGVLRDKELLTAEFAEKGLGDRRGQISYQRAHPALPFCGHGYVEQPGMPM
jgi:hypothetical protein